MESVYGEVKVPAMSCCAFEMVELEPMDLWRMCCIRGAKAPNR